MSHLLTRILLGTLLIPSALLLDFIINMMLDQYLSNPKDTWASNLITAALVIPCWCLLWRKLVTWTPRRMALTFLALLPATIVGMAGGWYIGEASFESIGIFTGVMIALFLWMSLTASIWRETARERSDRFVGAVAIAHPS